MFSLLLALGFLGLAPAVLLPEWRAYEAAKSAEQIEAREMARMLDLMERQRHVLRGLRDDPAVIVRLAKRDLNMREPNVRDVYVTPMASIDPSAPPPVANVRLPAFASRVVSKLPDLDYDGVFCEPASRTIIVFMSVIAICLALLLYGFYPIQKPGAGRLTD